MVFWNFGRFAFAMRNVAELLLAALLAMILATAAALAQDTADWTGDWDTLWPGGGARITFQQTGEAVDGAYPLLDGKIEAKADGRRLFGTWAHDGSEGTFLFIQSDDGASFAGRFDTGAWWTGARTALVLDPALRVERTSPAATLQSFLRVAGRSRDGFLEWLGQAAHLVAQDTIATGRTDALQQVALLDDVLGRLTFRFIDLPRGIGVDEVTTHLTQAGTGIGLDLRFRKVDGDWLIVSPAAEELAAVLLRLQLARGDKAEDGRSLGDRSSPRAAMETFIRGIKAEPGPARDAAYATLNASEVPELARSREIPLQADFLFRVIDRIGFVYWEEIPDDPDDVRPYVHYRHPAGDIVLAPFGGDGEKVWQFTPETLRSIRRVHAAIEDMPLPPELEGRIASDPYFIGRGIVHEWAPSLLQPLGRLERWQWMVLAILLVIGLVGGRALFPLAAAIAPHRQTAAEAGMTDGRVVLSVLRTALMALAVGVVLLVAVTTLGLPPTETNLAATVGLMLIVGALVPLLWESVTRLTDRYRSTRTVSAHQETFLQMVGSLSRIAIVTVAALLLADIFEVPWQGVVAGLGIGGLAVALAVQPLLQNFIAGFVLYADHPLAVGDFCRFGDKVGTVESVGIRSTRIRSLDRTVITIPNAAFADMQLENYTRRDRMWLRTMIQLRYETSPDQLRFVIAELRKLLLGHPMVLSEPLRVRLVEFGEYALHLELFAYVGTDNYDDFLAVREDIYLQVMSVIETCGCQFAFPSQVHYAADDEAMDPDRQAEAEATVAGWRRDGRLPFPDFDWEDKAAMRGALSYPPAGSAVGADGPKSI